MTADLLALDIFSADAAGRAGVSTFELKQAVRNGTVLRLKRGWYTGQRPQWPSDRHRLRVQIELGERANVVASHYSAAAASGLPVHRPDWRTVHLMRTDEQGPRTRSGLVIHARVQAQPGLALAIAQTALTCPVSGLMAFDAALHAERVTAAEVAAVAKSLAGLPGFAHLTPVLRLGDARRESPLESRTALTYDGWNLPLDPQFMVPGTRFRADGRIVGTAVLVESDGEGKYDDPGAGFREKVREDDLRTHGWEVVRVTSDLLDRPAMLLARTRTALRLAERRRAA